MNDACFHIFSQEVSGIALPRQFTFPFYYAPHPLCRLAADEVRSHLATHSEWSEELGNGKMMGVLVAKDESGRLGFLAAFSGNLGGSNRYDYFVPPIYNLLEPQGEFKTGEAEISAINHHIAHLEQSPELTELKIDLQTTEKRQRQEENDCHDMISKAKKHRERLRRSLGFSEQQQRALIAESQFQKAELKRMKRRHEAEVSDIQEKIDLMEEEITLLKQQRKAMSEALQRRIFRLFRVRNAKGEEKDLTEIFQQFHDAQFAGRRVPHSPLPPSGAGECCAPKLLQYAYIRHFEPVCMAEFWCGASSTGEIRHDGHFYPACRSKCLPILTFMLQGLDVEPNPLENHASEEQTLDIIYEDEWLMAVNKPAGMLTVPGKVHGDSLQARLRHYLPHATCPIVVHRLDMATSGIVIAAKSLEVYRKLQSQFAAHTVKKRYIALLNGMVNSDNGNINLPLCPDPDDRPRQVVDHIHGKKAVTRYHVLGKANGKTRIEFTPITGRTHQLRVHASSPAGLNTPIVGDTLYGQGSDRLYLHAETIAFTHPVTGKSMTFTAPAPF